MAYIFFFKLIDTGPIPVRLVGGSSQSDGRVEVLYNNIWGRVCVYGWGTTEAAVVCRQLGLPHRNAQPIGAAVFGSGTGPIWLDRVACGGSESSLDECLSSSYQWGNNNCGLNHGAGVVCTNGNYIKLIML